MALPYWPAGGRVLLWGGAVRADDAGGHLCSGDSVWGPADAGALCLQGDAARPMMHAVGSKRAAAAQIQLQGDACYGLKSVLQLQR